MTDRELLELAAKAAGIQGRYELGVIWCKNPFGDEYGFNPLNDDGDALRLAVKLDLSWRRYGTIIEVVKPSNGYVRVLDEFVGDDKLAATRRAIVRAAAEIGKAVQKPLAP